jgi:hypothetical protein
MNLEEKIKNRLTKYLGFDYSEIINDNIDYAYIFGGAIRDSIANKKINDIDILCLPNSKQKIIKIIKKHGYIQTDLVSKDTIEMYSKLRTIFEPFNYIKIIDNELRTIQLITPTIKYSANMESVLISNFHFLLGQVDMSNCAVHFSNAFGLRESYLGAINHCKHNVFEVLDTKMKTDRFELRYQKFINRGWEELNEDNMKNIIRSDKLHNIIDDANKTKYFLPTHGIQKKVKAFDDLDLLF